MAETIRANTGVVVPVNARKKLDAVRNDAGLKHWSKNGLRHSFASYRLAATHDAPRVASELGHTSPQMLYSTLSRTGVAGRSGTVLEDRSCHCGGQCDSVAEERAWSNSEMNPDEFPHFEIEFDSKGKFHGRAVNFDPYADKAVTVSILKKQLADVEQLSSIRPNLIGF